MRSGPGDRMNAEMNRDLPTPALAVQALVAEHGLVQVALALAGHIARRWRRPARVREADLPDRMRRDIGLPPLPPSRNWWER